MDFVTDLQALNLEYMPIVIVTTHVNSKRTYDILHREGVDFILYKDHPNYSANLVLNHFISMRQSELSRSDKKSVEDELKEGGEYQTKTGQIKKIDLYRHLLVFTDGTQIDIENLTDVETLF